MKRTGVIYTIGFMIFLAFYVGLCEWRNRGERECTERWGTVFAWVAPSPTDAVAAGGIASLVGAGSFLARRKAKDERGTEGN